MIDNLHEAIRASDFGAAHRLGRKLANAGIGTTHRKYGYLPAETPTVEQMVGGMKQDGKNRGFKLEQKTWENCVKERYEMEPADGVTYLGEEHTQ